MAAANDPKTLLLPDEHEYTKTYLQDKWIPALMGLTAFSVVTWRNYTGALPLFSGIQKHIGWTAFWAFAGTFISERRIRYLSDKDALLRHYIELHPEDFPTPERKKLKDVFKPWRPCR